MSDILERDVLTETEMNAIRDVARRGTFDAFDGRADGRVDVDALGDVARIGERIADGFSFMRGEW